MQTLIIFAKVLGWTLQSESSPPLRGAASCRAESGEAVSAVEWQQYIAAEQGKAEGQQCIAAEPGKVEWQQYIAEEQGKAEGQQCIAEEPGKVEWQQGIAEEPKN